MIENRTEPPQRDILDNLKYGVWKATALKAALELDLFTAIAEGHQTLEDIVAATDCSPRGMGVLLDVLCPIGLLSKSGSKYVLTPTSEAFLVRGRATYYGDWCLRTQLAWEARGRIAEGVRTGMPVGVDPSNLNAEDLWASCEGPSLLTWPREAEEAREMWKQVGVSKETRPGVHVLDIACGSGVKSFVLAQGDPDAHITALDFPKVLELADKVAEAMGVRNQVALVSGDILTAHFGTGEFDIVFFGAILFYFNPEQVRKALQKANEALKPGGMVVINAPIADEERCKAEVALMAAFQLFIFAAQSRVYSFSEYKSLLEKAKFTDATQHSDFVISARKEC